MAKSLGIVAGLILLFSSGTVLADNHLDKSEIDKSNLLNSFSSK